MNDSLYEPISIACVLPDIFPQVVLFTKTNNNYVLYKDKTTQFTEDDRDRLLKNKTEIMYVRSGDIDDVYRFTELNLSEIIERTDVDQSVKSAAVSQTASNYLKEIFADPEISQNAQRCRDLTGNLAKHISATQSISSLIKTLGGSTPFAIKHSIQVAAMTMLVWSKLFPEQYDDLVDVGTGGMLHDIGMSLIFVNILEDTDYWTTPSATEIRRHPFEGYVFLRRTGQYNDIVLDAVRHHHERYNGGGYPGGLKGDEIKISTQVIGLADMYCTLITDRSTRIASTTEEAFRIIGDESHKCFSSLLLAAFQTAIKE